MARQTDENVSSKGWKDRSNGEVGEQNADAIEMLKADHRRVEQLFDKYEDAKRRAEKSKLAQQMCLELTIHAELEEEIFYPACREHVDDLMLDEAQVEHDAAKILIAEIAMGTPQMDPFFDAKVMVLAEYMRHHIQEEEKNADSIFAKALEGGVDTAALGKRMMARRQELMEEYSEELLLPQPKALHVTLEQEEEVWAEQPGRGARQRGEGGRGERRGREEESWGRGEREEGRGWEGRETRGEDERRAGGRESEQRGWQEESGRTRGQGERGGRGEESRGAGREHRGWFGDPKRHSEASRRGWEHRR